MADILTQPLQNGADVKRYMQDETAIPSTPTTEPVPSPTPGSAPTPSSTTPATPPVAVTPPTTTPAQPATVAQPKQALREFAATDGYVVTDDPNKRMVYVQNPSNGKQISFAYGQGAEYGVGYTVPGDGSYILHTVDDIAKLEGALGGPATPTMGTPTAPPSFESITGLTSEQTSGAVPPTPATTPATPSIVEQPVSFQEISGPGQFVSQYTGDLNELLQTIKNSKFTYDAETDPLWQQAKTDITKSVKVAMNARGILGSTITADRMTQVMASELPKYEARAYERYRGELEKLFNVFQMTMQMDERDYQRWADSWEMNYKATVANWDRQNQLFNQNISTYNAALDKIDMIGYVDNETAIITGLPVGTLSKSEREYLRDKADKIFFAKMEYNANVGIEEWRFSKEKELIEYKSQIAKDEMLYQTRVTSAFEKEMAAYNLRDWFTKADYEQQQAIQEMALKFDYWQKEADYNQRLDLEKMGVEQGYARENKAADSYYDQILAKYKADLEAGLMALENQYATTGTMDVKTLSNNIKESSVTDTYTAASNAAKNMIGQAVGGKVVEKVEYDSATKTFVLKDRLDGVLQRINLGDYSQVGLAMSVAGLAEKYSPAELGSIFSGIANVNSGLAYQLQPFAVALTVLDKINVPGDDKQTMENMDMLITKPSIFIPGDSVQQGRVLSAVDALLSLEGK